MTLEIRRIAILITCFNRKEKTLLCIEYMLMSFNAKKKQIHADVYLTDDGSIDGSTAAIRNKYPEINILKGNGNLFWAGGMRNSWKEALTKNDYDAYMLLNDDTILEETCILNLIKTHEYSIRNFGVPGIYIGSVRDPTTLEFTYGGRLLLNRWTLNMKNIIPNGKIQKCELGNANIMLVHKNVLDIIGIFSEKYIHGKADYDYTMRAVENKIPVLICTDYCGYCKIDNKTPEISKMTLQERIKYLKSPKGIELSGYMYFMKRFFPWRAPLVYISLWLKTILPDMTKTIDFLLFRREKK
jgi:GT2 family glycosyltransferase